MILIMFFHETNSNIHPSLVHLLSVQRTNTSSLITIFLNCMDQFSHFVTFGPLLLLYYISLISYSVSIPFQSDFISSTLLQIAWFCFRTAQHYAYILHIHIYVSHSFFIHWFFIGNLLFPPYISITLYVVMNVGVHISFQVNVFVFWANKHSWRSCSKKVTFIHCWWECYLG